MSQVFWLAPGDQELQQVQLRPQPQQQQVAMPSPPLDFDAALKAVTSILAWSRTLPRHDLERLRDVFAAGTSLLYAQTRCSPADQQRFEKELQAALVKQQ